jgi:glutaredoxin-like YruB-family protein
MPPLNDKETMMNALLKCLALTALFLGVLACSTTQGEDRTTNASSVTTAPTAGYPKIVIYSTSWCPHCKEAKEYLSSRKIPFTNLDVEEDISAWEDFSEKYQAKSVPLIVIGNDQAILKGFKRETFEKALQELQK